MKIATALVCVSACMSFPACAAEWVTVSESGNGYLVEVDRQSVSSRDGYRQAWVRYNLEAGEFLNGKTYKSTVYLSAFDCKFKEFTDFQAVFYADQFSGGESIVSKTVSRKEAFANMRAALPDTNAEMVLKWVCARRIK